MYLCFIWQKDLCSITTIEALVTTSYVKQQTHKNHLHLSINLLLLTLLLLLLSLLLLLLLSYLLIFNNCFFNWFILLPLLLLHYFYYFLWCVFLVWYSHVFPCSHIHYQINLFYLFICWFKSFSKYCKYQRDLTY